MYSDFLDINKNFQYSINLDLDMYSSRKIDEYIPTSDICDVLKRYVKSALGYNKEKATTLVGPYGKGKSFLLLVLSYLLGKKDKDKTYNALLDKIKKVDLELFNLITELAEKRIFLIPVLINSNYDNINQAILLGLDDALKREGINDIIPKTAFTIALDIIKRWESDNDTGMLMNCLSALNLDISTIKQGLKSYDSVAFEDFKSVYTCISKGLEFNPLVNKDIVRTLKDITGLIKEYGYSGLFLIFDEFSKFIESSSNNLMIDLKIVQDLAELANRSSTSNQVHFCCVTHKSLSLYKKNDDTSNTDSFKTVEGRFTEIRFNRSLEENFGIIANGIIKGSNYSKLVNDFINENTGFYERISNLGIFENKSLNVLYNECFPLNPIAVFILINLSELVAQNERTLFTFLSDTSEASFNYFVKNNSSGLLNADKIYDYFSDLFKEEKNNSIRNIWYRTESVLNREDSALRRKIIKTLAILLMINEEERLPCNAETISLCLFENQENVTSEIKELIDKHIFRKNFLNGLLSFAASNSKFIDEKIDLLSRTKFKNVSPSYICRDLPINHYYLPRKYNEENKITRFFKVVYLTEEEFLSLTSFKLIFRDNFCDGIICRILCKDINKDKFEKKLLEINDERAILQIPSKKLKSEFFTELKRNLCLNDIKTENILDDIANEEIDLLLQESYEDLNIYINESYNLKSFYFNCNSSLTYTSINDLMSQILDKYYTHHLVFNNELINRKNVTSQYQKAANNVIDTLLNDNDFEKFSETSPESSIYKAVLVNNEENMEFRCAIDFIRKSILSSEEKKVEVVNIINGLKGKEFGVRDGIIPILLAKAISELSDNILLYFDNKEILLNSANLLKACSGNNYYFAAEKKTKELNNYLEKCLTVFHVNDSKNFRLNVQNLAIGIRKYFLGLPSILRGSSLSNNFLGIDNKYLKYKALYTGAVVNPYEAIFIEPFSNFEVTTFKELSLKIDGLNSYLYSAIENFKLDMVNDLKKNVLGTESSLKMFFIPMIKNSNINTFDFNKISQKIFNYITGDSNYNDFDFINEISYLITGLFIEDWDNDYREVIISHIKGFIKSIEEGKTVDYSSAENVIDGEITDPVALLMLNNIESIFDEFSDSVSKEDKIRIINKIKKEVI